MAFVRKKRVHNNEYYQLVENYRENGKHRQRVLVHLGKHPNLESKIAAAAAEVEKAQERVTYLRGDLETLGEDIKRHYPRLLGGEWGGEIPTQPQLGELRYRVVQQRYGDEDYPDSPTGKSGFGDGPTHFWRYYWYLKTEYGVDANEFGHVIGDYWRLAGQLEGWKRAQEKRQRRLDELLAVSG